MADPKRSETGDWPHLEAYRVEGPEEPIEDAADNPGYDDGNAHDVPDMEAVLLILFGPRGGQRRRLGRHCYGGRRQEVVDQIFRLGHVGQRRDRSRGLLNAGAAFDA